jgi:hypothetical protein
MARRMAKNRMAGGGQFVELVPILDRRRRSGCGDFRCAT